MSQSEALTQFYKDIQAWIDGGCPQHRAFHKRKGLCGNLKWWSLYNLPPAANCWAAVQYELSQQFLVANLCTVSPFNKEISYYEEENKYTNPARLQWIKDHSL